jgi:hypothetical protein
MRKWLIYSDAQVPYHDPGALDILCAVGHDLKPDIQVCNGDFADWRTISTNYTARKDKGLVQTFQEELEIQREVLHGRLARLASDRRYNEGNHEFRLFRLLMQNEKLANVIAAMDGDDGQPIVSVDRALRLTKGGWKHSGEYPRGCWLDERLYVEHGILWSAKAGYGATRLLERRMVSCAQGHTERLAVVFRTAMKKHFFAAECGNLSGLKERTYSTAPHTAPELMDHQTGFLVVYSDGGDYWPVPVPIYAIGDHRRKAMFEGRTYRA